MRSAYSALEYWVMCDREGRIMREKNSLSHCDREKEDSSKLSERVSQCWPSILTT
jgi:hypothetical protein